MKEGAESGHAAPICAPPFHHFPRKNRLMKRTILTVLLTLGVVWGLGYGFAHHRHENRRHRSHFKEQVADICVDATLRTLKENGQHPKVGESTAP